MEGNGGGQLLIDPAIEFLSSIWLLKYCKLRLTINTAHIMMHNYTII